MKRTKLLLPQLQPLRSLDDVDRTRLLLCDDGDSVRGGGVGVPEPPPGGGGGVIRLQQPLRSDYRRMKTRLLLLPLPRDDGDDGGAWRTMRRTTNCWRQRR